MKKYFLLLGQQIGYQHPAPDRTAKKSQGITTDFKPDCFQIWPNRESMARSIRMQQKRARRYDDWTPLVKLTDGEGY